MNLIYLSTITTTVYIYIAIGAVSLLTLGIILYLLTKKKKPKPKPLDDAYLDDLYQALGEKANIKSIELVQKRLQIEVAQVKMIKQDLLKKLDTPAFVTGKKITLLIKDNANDVFKYLNEKRKEEA